MTDKEKLLKYLEKVPAPHIVTAKRIAKRAGKDVGLNHRVVTNYMAALVDTGEWEVIKVWSETENTAYRRCE